MPIDPVKIPQNVYVEDRIIGPITLRQIMLILGGAGVSYGIWAIFQSAQLYSIPYTVIAWTPAVIAGIFAFIKINDISMFRMVLLFMESLEKPKIRKWAPREGISINIATTKHLGEQKKAPPQKTLEQDNITLLSEMLDKGPDENELQHMTPVSATSTPQSKVEKQNETSSPSRPVNPSRVQVDSANDLVDDISHAKSPSTTPTTGSLLRDIHPPRS